MKRSQFDNVRRLLVKFSILLILFSLFRNVFYFINSSAFPPISGGDWASILLQGLRFDITALLYLNALPFIMHLLPFPFRANKIYATIQTVLFVVFNLFGIIIVLTDFAFFPFNAKRLDSEVLGLLGSLPTMISSFAADYWYLFILLILLAYGLFKMNSLVDRAFPSNDFSYVSGIISFLLCTGFMMLGLRGGIQPRPIRPVMASNYVPVALSPLVTNSPFTFLYSVLNRNLDEKHYFPEEELNDLFPIRHVATSDSLSSRRPNIVYMIMESFGGYMVGHLGNDTSYTPHLDSLSEECLVFTRSYSNGRRSSQGLVALSAGLPALMDDPFMYSPYLNNRIYGLPLLMKNLGYSTSFFNGSNKDMLGWEEFINAVGFEKYFSREDYPNQDHYDGHWGIYDHYFMKYFIQEAGEFKEPFFSAFFSLSSHDPYGVPDEYKKRFHDSRGPYYTSLRYSDWALSKFFKEARKQDWFDNTIFIITADHTINAADKSPDKDYYLHSYKTNRVGLYYIPTLIYAPGLIEPGKNNKVIQQLDLFDTSLELAGYEGPYYSFGESVFKESDGSAFMYVKGIYQLIEGDYILLMKEDEAFELYNYKEDRALKSNIISEQKDVADRMLIKLKAIVQQHNNTLLENNMLLN